MSEIEQIVKSSLSTDYPAELYYLYLGLEQVSEMALTLTSTKQIQVFYEDSVAESSKPTSFSLSPERREPIHLYEKISVEEWKKALLYDKTTVDDLVQKILKDFNIEQNMNNTEWFYDQVENMLSNYEKQFSLHLPETTRSMLRNLMIRIAYDKLCIRSLI